MSESVSSEELTAPLLVTMLTRLGLLLTTLFFRLCPCIVLVLLLTSSHVQLEAGVRMMIDDWVMLSNAI